MLPFTGCELLFILFYFYLRKKIDFRINRRVFFVGSVLIIILILIGIFVNKYSLYSILSTARGYFYMMLSFSIFINKDLKNISYIIYLSLGSVVGWLFCSLTFFEELVNDRLLDSGMAIYGNMISLSLAITIPFFFKKNKYIYVSIIMNILLSITSGIRRQILVSFLSLIFSFLFSIKFSVKNIIKNSLLIIVLAISFVVFYPKLDEYLAEISPVYHLRVIGKSEMLLTGNLSDSDETRTNSLNNFLSTIDENIFPRGFVSKRTTTDIGTGLFMDSPFVELFYTFSIGGCLLFFVYFISRFIFHFKNYYFHHVEESGVCIVSVIVICSLIFVEGSFLNYVFVTPFTGFVLARIYSNYNLATNKQ
jgi:hypothetical protein